MGTLKTTLKVESTDLFPAPVSFTTVNNNSIGAAYSGFNYVAVSTGGTTVSLSPVTSSGGFLYVSAPSTNTDAVLVTLDLDGTGPVLGLAAVGTIVYAGAAPGSYTPDLVTVAATTGGSGTGCQLVVTVDAAGPAVTAVNVDPANTGSGYAVGDTLTVDGALLGGAGADDMTIAITSLITSPTAVLQLEPGDVGFVPVGNGASDVNVVISSLTGTQGVNYFFGVR